MQPDRRGTRRKYMMFYTRVFDAVTGTALGHLVDITPEGAMLISEHPLPVDTAYRLRIELSSEEAAKALPKNYFSVSRVGLCGAIT